MAAMPAVLLFVLGSLPWPEALVAAREAPHAEHSAVTAARVDAVVMLGGILEPSSHDPFGFALGAGSQRLIVAFEVAREAEATALVLGGSGPLPGKPGVPAASLLCGWVRQQNLYRGEILHLGICQNTHDEAIRLNQLKAERGWKRIAIVTSAAHMQRAEATFRKLNGPVATVACDFRVYGVPQRSWASFPFPQTGRMMLLHDYLHEMVGYWVYRWRGWI